MNKINENYTDIVNIRNTISLLCLLILFNASALFAQTPEVSSQEYLEVLHKKKKLPGISAAVSQNGIVIWKGNYGTTDLQFNQLPNMNTVYQVGSVSKVITTALLMQMVKNGDVQLDVPIKKWIPDLPPDKQNITLRQLANHTSGIRHYNSREIEPKLQYNYASDALEVFINDPLQMTPNHEWSYSSYGTNLIAAVLEKSVGISFPELLDLHIFTPLKMLNSSAWGLIANDSQFAKFYNSDNQLTQNNISYKWAGGGLLSTVNDLIVFGNAHLAINNFFTEEELSSIFQAQSTINGKIDYQGIGWRLDSLNNGEPFYYHNGHISGGHAHISIQPKEGIVVVILSNKGSSFGAKEGNELVNILLNRDPDLKVVGSENEMQEFMKVINANNSGYALIKTAFENADIEQLEECVSDKFQSINWPNKTSFLKHMVKLFEQGGIAFNEANLDTKYSGSEVGSRIELFDLELSRGFNKNDIIVLRYNGKTVKIITIIQD